DKGRRRPRRSSIGEESAPNPSRETIFRPGISRVAVTAYFPETQPVLAVEFNLPDEFRSLPGIQFRNDHTRGAAMLAGKRFALKPRRNQNILVETIGEADVRRIAVVGGKEDVIHLWFWPNEIGDGEEGDTTPATVEFAPGGDAVEIAYVVE